MMVALAAGLKPHVFRIGATRPALSPTAGGKRKALAQARLSGLLVRSCDTCAGTP